jgi:hypothetical protein
VAAAASAHQVAAAAAPPTAWRAPQPAAHQTPHRHHIIIRSLMQERCNRSATRI